MTSSDSTAGVRAILLDIEGTTTPLSFVHDVLFSYARRSFSAFLRQHATEGRVRRLMADLQAEYQRDVEQGFGPPSWVTGADEASLAGAVAYLGWLMDRDRKATPLKTLQGLIWESAFRAGHLRGQVFEDVPRALERWTGAGLTVAIFSSGSALAQRLLFQHAAQGDLTRFLAAYFDTTIGPKREAASYQAIAAALGPASSEILFVSDVVEELDAARAAGCRTRLAVRPGNIPAPPGHDHPSCETFDAVP